MNGVKGVWHWKVTFLFDWVSQSMPPLRVLVYLSRIKLSYFGR